MCNKVNTENDYYKKKIICHTKEIEKIIPVKDIAYKPNADNYFLMDIYTPQKVKQGEKLPAVIIVHGEPSLKNAGHYTSIGQLVASSGIAAITFNHRLLTKGFRVTDIVEDINSLISYLISNSDKLGIDCKRLSIWSCSAGVPFGLYAGIHNNLHNIKCLVAYYGFGNLKHVSECFNVEISSSEIENFSPINMINHNPEKIPPIFIARSGLDRPIINASLDEFIIAALSNNLHIDVYNHSCGQHCFDVIDNNKRSHEIIHKTIDFLKVHL